MTDFRRQKVQDLCVEAGSFRGLRFSVKRYRFCLELSSVLVCHPVHHVPHFDILNKVQLRKFWTRVPELSVAELLTSRAKPLFTTVIGIFRVLQRLALAN
jgi:hypothetical protein